jgi:hypothetical protein
MASTELLVTPQGFTPPLRLAIVEAIDRRRALVIVDGALPSPGEEGIVHLDTDGKLHWIRGLSGNGEE